MADLYARPSDPVEVSLAGAPTGLGNVGVQVIDTPSSTVVVSRTVAAEVLAGSGLYAKTITAPAIPGTYTVLWDSGSVTPATTAADTLYVSYVPTPGPPSAGPDLITLAELKAAMGIAAGDVDVVRDTKLTQAITNASRAIITYTDRNLASSLVTETRTFEYDGDGFLEIDDAAAVTAVSLNWFNYTQVLDPALNLWRPEPYGYPVFTYMILPTYTGQINPEMGFRQNLDVLWKERRMSTLPLTASVTGTWGWPVVPADVKQAAIWTAAAFSEEPGDMRSESIEGYSWTRESNRNTLEAGALPDRAKDLLAPYIRWSL